MAEEAPTLRRWYEESRRPQLVWRLSPTSLGMFDRAIRSFEGFAGDGIRVDAIDEGKLAAFIKPPWLARQSNSRPYAYRRDLARCVRRIVRDFDSKLLAATDHSHATANDEKSHLSLRGYVDEIYQLTALAYSTEAHRANVRSKVAQFDDFHGGDVQVSELDDRMLEGFLNSLLKSKRSVGTVNQYRAIICAVWRQAYRVGFCPKPPRLKKLAAPAATQAGGARRSNAARAMILPFPTLNRE